MKTINQIAMALALGTSVFSVAAYAETTGDSYFREGVTAFKDGRYQSALELFRQARSKGETRPALYYNLGVCYFRLGKYSEARTEFRRAAEHRPLAAISHYNIGLIEQKFGNTRLANESFRLAANEAEDPRLRALAERQLPPAERPKTVSTSRAPWVSGINAAVGHDDNLIDPTKQAGSAKGSSFGSLLVYTTGMISGNYDDGVRLDLNGYFIRYPSQAYFNMNMLQAGLAKVDSWTNWKTEYGAQLNQDTLDGRDYLRTATVQLGANRQLQEHLKLRLRYRYSDINSLNKAFDPLQGKQQQFTVQLSQRSVASRLRVGYEFESNNRNDLTATTGFTSYSPTRNMVYVDGEMIFQGSWHLGGGLSYRTSRYNDPNTVTSSGTSTTRDDRRVVGRISLARDMTKKMRVTAEYSHTDNHSNIAAYTYKRNFYSVGVSYVF